MSCHHFILSRPLSPLFQSPLWSIGTLRTSSGSQPAFLGLTTETPGNGRDGHALKCLSGPASCHNFKPDVLQRCQKEVPQLTAAQGPSSRWNGNKPVATSFFSSVFSFYTHVKRICIGSGSRGSLETDDPSLRTSATTLQALVWVMQRDKRCCSRDPWSVSSSLSHAPPLNAKATRCLVLYQLATRILETLMAIIEINLFLFFFSHCDFFFFFF